MAVDIVAVRNSGKVKGVLMRAFGLCLLAGTCAVSMIIPIPATSQPSNISLGSGQFGAAAVEEVRYSAYRYAHPGYRLYYRLYHHPYYGDDRWPYYYRPHYYDPGWSRGYNATERLLQCLSAQPFVTCG